jgi:RimJ/RimL family protein N-acetyltransferase
VTRPRRVVAVRSGGLAEVVAVVENDPHPGANARTGSRWIGGLLVDAADQRTGVGRATVRALMDRFAAEPDCPNVALSYAPDNIAARRLYRALGFGETGETEGTELVARWTPRPVGGGDRATG